MVFFKFLKKLILKTLLFITKEFFSFIIKIFLLFIIITAITVNILKYSIQSENLSLEKNSVVFVDLSKEYTEKSKPLPKFFLDSEINFYSLIRRLDSIKKDKNISSIFLKLDNISLNRAQIEELSVKLDEIKKIGKKVISYANSLDNKGYLLALSSDEIIMPPTMGANVNITGYYTELAYYKGLADKLGVKFNVIHVGDYKTYGENFIRKEMSSEYKENIIRLQDKIYNNFLNKLVDARQVDKNFINTKILNGDFVSSEPYQMKKFNLIDKQLYETQIKEVIGEKRWFPIEKYQEKVNISNNKLALIYAEGNILFNNEKSGIGNSITPDKINTEIDKALKDSNIKGIVLRINSPGGSALASNLIYYKIKEASKIKPIYVSISGVAASGGYYIASAGNKIFADKESITGSIGVVSLIPNFNELTKKIDINIENVKKGEYSDLFSLTKEFTEDDREKIYASSLKVYNEFLDVVAQSRNLDRKYVHSIAQGKVWLGIEGKELGLIDELGGLEKAIITLAEDLQLNEYEVVDVIENDKLDTIVKQYLPFKAVLKNISTLTEEKELLFNPIYFFPYKI